MYTVYGSFSIIIGGYWLFIEYCSCIECSKVTMHVKLFIAIYVHVHCIWVIQYWRLLVIYRVL